MTTSTTRWRVPLAAWVPISIGILAETTSNGLRAYSLGTQLGRFTMEINGYPVSLAGVVLVFAAAAVSLSQSRAFWSTFAPGVPVRQRLICGIAAALLVTVSVTAMAGHILEANRAKTGNEKDDSKSYDRAQTAYQAAVDDYATVKGAKTPAQIEADADAAGAQIDANIWRRSNHCTDATQKASVEECRPVTLIRTQLAAAKRKADLEAKIPALQAALDKLSRPEDASDVENDVSRLWGWLIAISVVGIATAGPVLFARSETIGPEKPECSGKSEPIPANPVPANDAIPGNRPPTPPNGGQRGRKPNTRVLDFSEGFIRKHGRGPSGSEIRAQFPELPVSTAYDYAGRTRQIG